MQTSKNNTSLTVTNALDPHCWVDNYADYLYNYAFTRINHEQQAMDLVQDTFLAALEKIDSFENRSSERTWLTAILRNKVVDLYRKKSSGSGGKPEDHVISFEETGFFDAEDGHWKTEHQPKAFGIEQPDMLGNKEFNRILQSCMQKLPALWLSVFIMKHMDDRDTKSICRTLKLTASNFWVIIHRAKVNLRSCLQKNGV